MCDSKANGTFCTTKSKELCDFWTQVGVPEEHCKKLLGSHWESKICLAGKKVFFSTSCCECPEYNICASMIEGVENVVPCMPGFGGKATMCFTKTGENCYLNKMTHETFGTVEWTETFCDEGLKVDYCCKEKGLSCTEKWCRKVCEEGFYKYKCAEGDLNEIICSLYGPDMKIDECFKERYQKCGDTVKLTVCTGKEKMTNSWKLDEENTFHGVTSVVTNVGVGKYKTIQKKGTNVVEWTTCFKDCGYTATAVCQKTGKTAKLCMERYCEMSGSYKPVSFSGTKELCAAMGAPPGFADKFINDSKAMLCIKADGAFHCHSFKFSALPMEYSFKIGEEFDFPNPLDPTDVQKCVGVCNGNCLMMSGKGKNDYTTKMTFTEHFLIQETHLCGTQITEKVIYTRVDC
jgi:hypothetical protein